MLKYCRLIYIFQICFHFWLQLGVRDDYNQQQFAATHVFVISRPSVRPTRANDITRDARVCEQRTRFCREVCLTRASSASNKSNFAWTSNLAKAATKSRPVLALIQRNSPEQEGQRTLVSDARFDSNIWKVNLAELGVGRVLFPHCSAFDLLRGSDIAGVYSLGGLSIGCGVESRFAPRYLSLKGIG